ncbi:MAG: DUF424 family protein [Candidatus Thermoplasmatota archaeon]|nr:DUF424 family protein [Candidatus Thermoplasmatota archaeon]
MDDTPLISMKLHSAGGQIILASCDHDILGKELNMDGIPFKISENFYGGEKVNDETFLMILGQVTSANIVGNHCVQLLIDRGIVSRASVIAIDDVMHVQIYTVPERK